MLRTRQALRREHRRARDGNVVELSTKDRPLTTSTSYNPDLQSELDALLEKAQELHREITRKNVS